MDAVACPYFFPTEKSTNIYWAFPQRLPLGAGFCGSCTAVAQRNLPSETELRDFCNLGYATGCSRIPADRRSDAVRFAVAIDSGDHILVHYCCDRNHAPVEHGQLRYDCLTQAWTASHQNICIQRQAECYLSNYLLRRRK